MGYEMADLYFKPCVDDDTSFNS